MGLPDRVREGALQILHFREDMAEMFGMPAVAPAGADPYWMPPMMDQQPPAGGGGSAAIYSTPQK